MNVEQMDRATLFDDHGRWIVEGWHEIRVGRVEQVYWRDALLFIVHGRIQRTTSPAYRFGECVDYVVNMSGIEACIAEINEACIAEINLDRVCRVIGDDRVEPLVVMVMRRAWHLRRGHKLMVEELGDSEVFVDRMVYCRAFPKALKYKPDKTVILTDWQAIEEQE